MKLFLIFLFIALAWSHCPNNINLYNGDIDGLAVDLNNLPDKSQLEKFILGNFSIPNPVLSSHFAYQIRYLVEYIHCFNKDENKITFSLDGSIKLSGTKKNKDSLFKLAFMFDEITKDVLYSPRKVFLKRETELSNLVSDYNFECIQGHSNKLNFPQIRSTANCDRKIIFEADFKSHVFDGLKRIIHDWIN